MRNCIESFFIVNAGNVEWFIQLFIFFCLFNEGLHKGNFREKEVIANQANRRMKKENITYTKYDKLRVRKISKQQMRKEEFVSRPILHSKINYKKTANAKYIYD